MMTLDSGLLFSAPLYTLNYCHTSLFVTYALRGVTSQQQNRPSHLADACICQN